MKEPSPSIKEFINATISEIENSLPEGYEMDEVVEFEMSVATSKSKDGKLDLRVLSGKTNVEREVIQKISFSIVNAKQKEKNTHQTAHTLMHYVTKGLSILNAVGQSSPEEIKSMIEDAKLDGAIDG